MRIGRHLTLLLLLATSPGCLAQYEYAASAPPVEKTVALIESDPAVSAALGGNVDVSLAVARTFERDFLNATIRGRDDVRLRTEVRGGRGEATLELSATNVDAQGWAGSFTLRTEGRSVLRDGAYVTEGGGVLLEGTFAPDGSPIRAISTTTP